MPITKVPLNHHFISLYIDDESGIIFHHTLRTLTYFNATAVALFLAIDEGLEQQKALNQISALGQLTTEQLIPIYQDVHNLFFSQEKTLRYADGKYPELSIKATVPKPLNTITFCVADSYFAIYSNCRQISEDINQLLTRVLAENNHPSFFIEIIKSHSNKYNLQVNGLAVEAPCRYEELMPLLIDRIQILAFQHHDYLFCFHGAALQFNNHNLLLPGKSGAGKSTLSAELSSGASNANCALYSDEMIVLDSNFHLRCINLPIAIKSGSWDALLSKYPEIEQQKIWQRLDGRLLKYVWPKHFAKNDINKNQPDKNCIVNPAYKANNQHIENSTTQLSVFSTLAMLTGGGYQVGKELVDADIMQLFTFLENTPSYTMTYQSSEQALIQLQTITAID